MKSRRSRSQLLGEITGLRNHGSCLRVIDTPISVDERVSAWLQRGEREVTLFPQFTTVFLLSYYVTRACMLLLSRMLSPRNNNRQDQIT